MMQRSCPANDNHQWRCIYQDEPELLRHIPQARYPIAPYARFFEKNLPNHFDFVFLEHALCAFINLDTSSPQGRALKAKWIARDRAISPLTLYNDPSISF